MLSFVEIWGARKAIAHVSRLVFADKDVAAKGHAQAHLKNALIECMHQRLTLSDPLTATQLADEAGAEGRIADADLTEGIIAAVVSGCDINDAALGMMNRAAMNGDVHVLEVLWTLGADVDVATSDGSFPLGSAAF